MNSLDRFDIYLPNEYESHEQEPAVFIFNNYQEFELIITSLQVNPITSSITNIVNDPHCLEIKIFRPSYNTFNFFEILFQKSLMSAQSLIKDKDLEFDLKIRGNVFEKCLLVSLNRRSDYLELQINSAIKKFILPNDLEYRHPYSSYKEPLNKRQKLERKIDFIDPKIKNKIKETLLLLGDDDIVIDEIEKELMIFLNDDAKFFDMKMNGDIKYL